MKNKKKKKNWKKSKKGGKWKEERNVHLERVHFFAFCLLKSKSVVNHIKLHFWGKVYEAEDGSGGRLETWEKKKENFDFS